MVTTVYIVSALGGQWGEAWEHPVKVVRTEDRAKELVKELTEAEEKDRKEAAEFIEKWRDSECLEDEPVTYYDFWGEPYTEDIEHVEYECSDKCKRCQADRLEWRDNTWYRYEAVEMEES